MAMIKPSDNKTEEAVNAILMSSHRFVCDICDDLDEGGRIRSMVQSPIEYKLLMAVLFYNRTYIHESVVYDIDVRGVEPKFNRWSLRESKYGKLTIIPQFKIGKYRADLAVFTHGTPLLRFCVECDGHDFHERTKAQVSKDKRRDREIADSGFRVVRFAGSEIHGDALGCAEFLLSHIQNESASLYEECLRFIDKSREQAPVENIIATPFVWKDPATIPRRVGKAAANDNSISAVAA